MFSECPKKPDVLSQWLVFSLYLKAAGSGAASTAMAVPLFLQKKKLNSNKLTQTHRRNNLLYNMLTSFGKNMFRYSSGIRASSRPYS